MAHHALANSGAPYHLSCLAIGASRSYGYEVGDARERFRFNPRAFACATALLMVEIGIALWGGRMPWVRGFVGDVLAVVLLYYCFRSIVRIQPNAAAVLAFLVALGIEGIQWLYRTAGWHIHNHILRTLIGATPDWLDVLAYSIGFSICLLCIKRRHR